MLWITDAKDTKEQRGSDFTFNLEGVAGEEVHISPTVHLYPIHSKGEMVSKAMNDGVQQGELIVVDLPFHFEMDGGRVQLRQEIREKARIMRPEDKCIVDFPNQNEEWK